MKRLIAFAALLALYASVAVAEEKKYDVPGVFSFSYGDGWNKGQRNGAKATELDWLVSTTDPNATFNAVMTRADFSYQDWITKTIKTATPYRVLTSKGDFTSASGEKGYKLVWTIKSQNGEELIRNQYLFRGKGDTQILLSGMVDSAQAAQFAPIFDDFAKSFAITKSK